MEKKQELMLSENELDKDLTFEVSKDVKVTTKLTYKKGDVMGMLINKIKELENKISKITYQKVPSINEESLGNLWNNEYDERWNQC